MFQMADESASKANPGPVVSGFAGGDFVVSASHVLHEGVSGGQGLS